MIAVSEGGEPTLHKALDEAASAGEEERDQQVPCEGAGRGCSLCLCTVTGETPRGCQRQISMHAWNSICAGPEVSGAVNDTPKSLLEQSGN